MLSKRKHNSVDSEMPPLKMFPVRNRVPIPEEDLDAHLASLEARQLRFYKTKIEAEMEQLRKTTFPLEKLPNEVVHVIVSKMTASERAALYPMSTRMNAVVQTLGILDRTSDYIYLSEKMFLHQLGDECVYVVQDQGAYADYQASLGFEELLESTPRTVLKYAIGNEYETFVGDYLRKRGGLCVSRMFVTEKAAENWKEELFRVGGERPVVVLCGGSFTNDKSERARNYIEENDFELPEANWANNPIFLHIDPNGSATDHLLLPLCEFRNWPAMKAVSLLEKFIDDELPDADDWVFTWQAEKEFRRFLRYMRKYLNAKIEHPTIFQSTCVAKTIVEGPVWRVSMVARLQEVCFKRMCKIDPDEKKVL